MQLLDYPNVVATALGRYLIRIEDEWPDSLQKEKELFSSARKQKPPRRLDNSEVRSYSWPCLLVFVREWIDYGKVEHRQAPGDVLVPRRLWLPDGRVVPVCVVEAKPVALDRLPIETLLFPGSFLGAGYPVAASVQGRFQLGTIGPLVTNGQRVFALTSRHVLGPPGSEVGTFVHGVQADVGRCAEAALTRVPVGEAYPRLTDGDAYLNIDVGLIDIDEVDRWTSVAYGIGPLAPVADAGSASLSLALIGRTVVAHGAASGPQRGQIKGLLFRYKSVGGAEYFSDFLIGSADEDRPLTTRPGDSGALWCLLPESDEGELDATAAAPTASGEAERLPPLALQWGGEVLYTTAGQSAPYVLGSSLATVCRLLDLDLVWDWQASLFRYWGGVGHYSIALLAIEALPNGELKTLLTNNLTNITFPQDGITERDLKGLSQRFVPLADVPDLAWKIGVAQRGPRNTNPERPNHFADMDEPGPDGKTLLDICTDKRQALDPNVWLDYFASVGVNDPIRQGLLPFRVWQIYNGMIDALERRSVTKFVCAAGVLAHYVGDACQPLHISIYADGDPNKTETRTIHHRDGKVEQQQVKAGQGVHGAYEDDMINHHIGEIFAGLQSLPAARRRKIKSGRDAAWATVNLMRQTHDTIPPADLVDTYISVEDETPTVRASKLWETYGNDTIAVLGDGIETLANLWRSAWNQADAENSNLRPTQISQDAITKTITNRNFLRSYTLEQIATHLDS